MYKKKVWLIILALALIPVAAFGQQSSHPQHQSHGAAQGPGASSQSPDFLQLHGFSKKCWIGADYYFIYQFDRRPQLGTAILKIQLFDKSGNRSTDLNIVGSYGMPSMKGAHDSGNRPFKLNKKGDYLLPVNIVMAGEWEVKLTFLKDNLAIHRGSFRFTV